jgi:hypothetical protein
MYEMSHLRATKLALFSCCHVNTLEVIQLDRVVAYLIIPTKLKISNNRIDLHLKLAKKNFFKSLPFVPVPSHTNLDHILQFYSNKNKSILILSLAGNPEGMLPWKRNSSGPLHRNTLSNKRVSLEMKGQQRVRCMTEAETKDSYMVRVVGGDEKGSLKSGTVKYGLGSQGTRTQERLHWQGPAAYIKDRPVLSSERALHRSKTVTVKR